MKKSNHYTYISILNILACFLVIILHTTEIYFKSDFSKRWYFATLLQSLCICAVPLFTMITGATLLDYKDRYSTKDFYKKRLFRVVVPFLIWSVIYAVWGNYTGQIEIINIKDFLNKFLNNEILSIFWFFYSIIGIYIAIPVLSVFLQHAHKHLIWLYIAMCFFATGLVPLIFRITGYNLSKFQIPIAGALIIYVLLGWILKQEVNYKKISIYLIAIFSSVCMFLGTIYYSKQIGSLDRSFITSGSPFSILLSISVFLLVKSISWEKILTPRVIARINSIASTSFGVYLIQKIVMYYIKKMSFVDPYSPLYSTIGALSIYLLCVIIVLVLKKVPVLKRLIP